MSRDQRVAFLGSLVAGAVFTILLLAFGAPPWAAGGLGYLSFLVFRLGDR